jgi:hypothetical protein
MDDKELLLLNQITDYIREHSIKELMEIVMKAINTVNEK